MPEKILVIGGGQAAASFLARYRQHDKEADITLISQEAMLPYRRPPLSKKYATGEMTSEQLLLRPQDWYDEMAIDCRLGITVTGIDTQSRTITMEDGEASSWDTLLLATGSRPRRLPDASGGNLDGIYELRSRSDADMFACELREGRRVAIIGGGYVGLEAAAVCAGKGLEVTLIEAADRILQRVACRETSDWFRALHEARGVTIHEGLGLESLQGEQGRVSRARLAGGAVLEVDFVLVGIGVEPNIELAQEAGLKTENGIVVDGACRTSHPDIYSAGDCTSFSYRGEMIRLESVQNAIDQAECAADNTAGAARDYQPHPWFWSDQYDVKLQIAGLNRGYDTIIARSGEREGAMSHFYFSGDTFLAVDSMNDPRTYMVCKKLLESGKTITPEQAVDQILQLKSLM